MDQVKYNTNSDSLVEAETAPEKERLDKKIEENNASISAFGELT